MIRITHVFAAVAAAALALTATPAVATHRAVTTISGPSPYASCVTGAHDDAVTVNEERAPPVAANPVRRRNLVAVWNQDGWSSKGSHGIVAGASFDGGRSWQRTPLPFTTCAPGGGLYGRAISPYVSFGTDGTA